MFTCLFSHGCTGLLYVQLDEHFARRYASAYSLSLQQMQLPLPHQRLLHQMLLLFYDLGVVGFACAAAAATAFQIDEQSKGNSLVIVGNMMLQPLSQREGLLCTRSQIRCFMNKVQQQYCSNSYHNHTHAAMVAHCCRCIVGDVIPNKKECASR